MNQLISIIIPVYNAEKFISKCLDSILAQTYKNIEILCINDGSKDNSLEILREYSKKDNRILIVDKKNAGVSAARNDGIIKSTGDYIMFVDADDWLESNAIEMLYNTLIRENVDVVRGNYYRNITYDKFDYIGDMDNLKNIKIFLTEAMNRAYVIQKFMDKKLHSFIWLFLIKKESVLKTSLFKTDVFLMEDTIFCMELFENIESIYFLNIPLYHYYCNMSSCTTSSEYYIRNMYNLLNVYKYLKNFVDNSKCDLKNSFEKMKAEITNIIINHFYTMYRKNLKSKKELVEEINKILANQDAYNLFKSTNVKYLSFRLRIPIRLILKKDYKKLFAFYKFRKLVRYIIIDER